MTVHSLIVTDADAAIVLHGVYSTAALARQALVDHVEGSPIGRPDDWPEDWYLEPTAFDFATELLASETDWRWVIVEVELDVDAKGVDR